MGKSIVLLSGGLDSVVLANYIAETTGEEVVGLFFSYDQPFLSAEFSCAERCILNLKNKGYKASFTTIEAWFDDSNDTLDVEIPARNVVFVAKALHYALSHGCMTIYAGFINTETELYKDANKQFVASMNAVTSQFGVEFKAPFLSFTKADIFRMSVDYGIKLEDTWSCNTPKKEWVPDALGKRLVAVPCGKCGNCLSRKVFQHPILEKDPEKRKELYLSYPLTYAQLICSEDREVNIKNIAKLIENGIEDIFLFTDTEDMHKDMTSVFGNTIADRRMAFAEESNYHTIPKFVREYNDKPLEIYIMEDLHPFHLNLMLTTIANTELQSQVKIIMSKRKADAVGENNPLFRELIDDFLNHAFVSGDKFVIEVATYPKLFLDTIVVDANGNVLNSLGLIGNLHAEPLRDIVLRARKYIVNFY